MNDAKHQNIIELIVKIALIVLLIYSSYTILEPFFKIVIWAVIIAVALNPLIVSLNAKTGMSKKTLSFYVCVAFIFLILAPIIGVALSFHDTMETIMSHIHAGTLNIPQPSQNIASIPFVGEQIYNTWLEASTNLKEFLASQKEETIHITKTALKTVGHSVVAVISFMGSVIVAGFLTSASAFSEEVVKSFARKIAKEQGEEWLNIAVLTVRSVVKGVIGIALIQTALGYGLFVAFDLPGASVLALAVLILAIAQIPLVVVMAPLIVYVFSTSGGVSATIFAVLALLLGLSDNVLRPLLLGKGVDVPMLVILIGAIGGLIAWGILGLFIGSVILAVTYKLVNSWLKYEVEAN